MHRSGGLDHAAQFGNHVQPLLLAQILRTHDRLLVEQVAGTSLLLEVTLDYVDGPIHLLAGNLFNPLVGNGDRHRLAPPLLGGLAKLVTSDPPCPTSDYWRTTPLSRI